jgi:hypothetical protein
MTLLRRRLPTDMYNRRTTLLYGTVDELNVALKRDCPTDFEPLDASWSGHWMFFTDSDGVEVDYLCIVTSRSRDYVFEVLAHEALHLVSHALRTAGIPLQDETDEAYTYYQQWVIRECLAALRTAGR